MRHDPPEYRLIAAALAGGPPGTPAPWDWDRTVQIAAREQVLPTLHGKLKGPQEILNFLEAVHRLNAERNRQLVAELENLGLILNAAGIEPLLLKGAAYLAAGVYTDPAARYLEDIDIAAQPSYSAHALETIRNSGYRLLADKPSAWGRHHYPVLFKAGSIPVELHQSLGLGASAALLPLEQLLAESTPLRLGQARVRVPSPEHLMTHLVIHSQIQHGPSHRVWPPLRSMYDLALLQRRFTIPWEKIRDRFRSHGKAGLLELHLKQVQATLNPSLSVQPHAPAARWRYRQLLWRKPRLRYLDPSYLLPRIFADRLQVARQLLKDPAGRRFVLTSPFRADFYRHLFGDIGRV